MDKVCCYCRYFENGICHNKDSDCYHTFNGYEDTCDWFLTQGVEEDTLTEDQEDEIRNNVIDEIIRILEGMKQ